MHQRPLCQRHIPHGFMIPCSSRSEGQAWICRRTSVEDLVNETCWLSSPSTSLFEKKTGEKRSKGWRRNRGREAARPESIHLLLPECFLSCLHRPQSCPKRPKGWWWDTSDPAKGITHSLGVLLSLVLGQAPAMDVQSGAGQEPGPGLQRAPSLSPTPALLPALLQKHCWDHPPSPLDVVVYFS